VFGFFHAVAWNADGADGGRAGEAGDVPIGDRLHAFHIDRRRARIGEVAMPEQRARNGNAAGQTAWADTGVERRRNRDCDVAADCRGACRPGVGLDAVVGLVRQQRVAVASVAAVSAPSPPRRSRCSRPVEAPVMRDSGRRPVVAAAAHLAVDDVAVVDEQDMLHGTALNPLSAAKFTRNGPGPSRRLAGGSRARRDCRRRGSRSRWFPSCCRRSRISSW
jgi:hypothetical protein